ncbi:phosphatidylinositol-binding clathrin assembly protein isoform X1 [Tachysurus ichikawai]
MFYTGYQAPAPMAFPMTTPQVPVYGMVPPQMGQMGGVPMMTPQPMMYQPVLRSTNPFAPVPGAQMALSSVFGFELGVEAQAGRTSPPRLVLSG